MAFPIINPTILYGAALRRFDRLRERTERGYFRKEVDPVEEARLRRWVEECDDQIRASRREGR
jgi:hypothetical protein